MHFIVRERDSFEERNHPSTSFINFSPQLDLSSLEDSPMAHMLVQRQQQQHTFQTPNMNILPTTSTINRDLPPLSHSYDDRLFYLNPESTNFFDILERFASEPHISKCHLATNGFSNKSLIPSLSLPNTFSSLNRVKEEQEHANEREEVNITNCDTIQPVINDDLKSDTTLDTISSVTTDGELNEDSLLNVTPLSNSERHFRRRQKRRSSLTQVSCLSTTELEPLKTDVIEKNKNHEEDKSQTINDNSQPILLESLSLEDNNVKKEDISIDNETSHDTAIPSSRLRPRRLRYRASRQTISAPEPVSENEVEFFLPTETCVVPTPIPSPSTPPPSPTAPVPSSTTNSNTLPGGLKRIGSVGTTKKMVRFADSVGRELAQVQYIRPITDDDATDLLGSKNKLYVPSELNFEPKPWSFDVAWTSKQLAETRVPKRFFCLYRQPNSEHPDIYLHEVWRSQIKLEHADIHLKSSTTGEQYLRGTVWVTNAGYWKNVTVKYTFNRWLNTCEYDAQYLCHSNDFRNIDQFVFNIDIPQDVDRIDFVLRYQVNGQEHWDNNEGRNYTLETESSSTPQTTISLPHDCDFNEMRFY